jgi:hypothetical protein
MRGKCKSGKKKEKKLLLQIKDRKKKGNDTFTKREERIKYEINCVVINILSAGSDELSIL